MLACLLLGCSFGAATKIDLSDTGAPAGATDSAADTGEGGDTGPAPGPSDRDDDGDGFSENQGDCDDDDAGVHPDARETCDGRDEDCDGSVDDGASTADAYEPNDTAPYDLGSLEEDPERSITATLVNDDDVDRFSFAIVDDTWDFFTVTATLSDIPADATWRFTLNRLASDGGLAVGEVAQTFGSGTLSLSLSDQNWQDDGGTYELVVEAVSGADCGRSYLLGVGQ